MADLPFKTVTRTAEEVAAAPIDDRWSQLFDQELGDALNYRSRNTLLDSGVSILDTLQSLGTVALSPLPGVNLEDATSNSQFLDEARSPALLQERKDEARRINPDASFGEAALEAASNVLEGSNLIADLSGQTPYLLMGPVSRLAAVDRFAKSTSVAGRIAELTVGRNTPAVVNRIAALSGVIEGGSAYGQTYQRALEQYGDSEIAEDQAMKAGAFNAVVGAVLGRLTPAFELNPSGVSRRSVSQYASDALGPHLSAVASEAIVEEGGLAIASTVADNILAGRDPMEGAGVAFGEAAAISGVFAGGIRTPGAIVDTAKAVGKGFIAGMKGLAGKAITPEMAAVNEAAAAANAPATETTNPEEAVAEKIAEVMDAPLPRAPYVEPPSIEPAIRAELESQGLEGESLERAVQIAMAASEPIVDTLEEAIPDEPTTVEEPVDAPAPVVEESGDVVNEVADEEVQEIGEVDTNSNNPEIKAILVGAVKDAEVENTTGATQAAAIEVQQDLFPAVEKAREFVQKISDERVEQYVDLAKDGNKEAARVVEAVARTDISKLPTKAVPKKVRKVAAKIKEMKELKLDNTTSQIFETGFNGSNKDKLGLSQYLQQLTNLDRSGVKKVNPIASRMASFVNHLAKRAEAFEAAMASPEDTVQVAGSSTRTEEGELVDKPFTIYKKGKGRENSLAVVKRVAEDAKRAQEVLALARKTFPDMFEKEVAPEAKPSKITDEDRQRIWKGRPRDAKGKYELSKAQATAAWKKLKDKKKLGVREQRFVDYVRQALETPATVEPSTLPATESQAPEASTVEASVPVTEVPVNPVLDGLVESTTKPAYYIDEDTVTEDEDTTVIPNKIQQSLIDKAYEGVDQIFGFTLPRLKVLIKKYKLRSGSIGAHYDHEGKQIVLGQELFLGLTKNPNSIEYYNAVHSVIHETTHALEKGKNISTFVESFLIEYSKASDHGKLLFDEYALTFPAGTQQNSEIFAEFGATLAAQKDVLEKDYPNSLAIFMKLVLPVTEPVKFTTFDGVNRFKESFTPTGGGFLEKSYTDLINLLKAGDENEQRAAETLEKYVPNFKKSIDGYIQRILNGPVSTSNKTKLKDALTTNKEVKDFPNYVWINLLTKTEDGYALHPAVLESAAVAAVMQLVREASLGNIENPNSPIGMEEVDSRYYQWMNNSAKDAMRILGVTGNTDASMTLEQGIPLSLAGTVLEVLREREDVNVTTDIVTLSDGSKRTIKGITMSSDVRKLLLEFPAFPSVMRKFLGDADDDTIHYGDIPTEVNERYRNSRTPISDSQRTALQNRQKVVHNRNVGFKNVLEALGDKYDELITGFSEVSKDPQLAKLSKSLITGIRGETNALKRYNAGIELAAAEQGIDPDELAVRFSYEILKNGRSFSGYSPQTKKTLREFLSIRMKPMDLTNQDHVRKLKLAIAQSLGIKTDINTHDVIIQKLDDMLKDPKLIAKAEAVYKASQGEAVDNLFELLDRPELYEPKELHGLMILGKYLSNPTDTNFKNTLTFEIDGKTNGPFMAELLFGLHTITRQTQMNLEQGGLFIAFPKAMLATMQTYLRYNYGSVDLYERVAKGAWAMKEPLLILAGFVNDSGQLTRTAAKEAVTPLVYGSGVASLAEVFEARINAGLTQRLRLELKKPVQDGRLIAILRSSIESGEVRYLGEQVATNLEASYADQKKAVAETNKMIIAATSLHAHIRGLIFTAQTGQLRADKRAKGALPKQYELSRDEFNAALAETPTTGVPIPGMGMINVGENSNTGRSSSVIAGAGKKNNIAISIPEIQNPRVSMLANGTIGGGDAAMGNGLFQNEEQVLDVYDGIEMDPLDVDTMGKKLNEIVWNTASDSILDGYAPLMKWVAENEKYLLNMSAILPFLKNDKLPRTKEITKAIENAKEVFNVTHESVLLDIEKASNNIPLGKLFTSLRDKFKVASTKSVINALAKELAKLSEKNKAGRARLNAKQAGFNQMSGGGEGYTTPGNGIVRDSVTTDEIRDEWDSKIEAGFDANGGKLDRAGIIAVLDKVKWPNKIQKLVWSKLRNALPEATIMYLAKNEEQWNDLTPEERKPYGTVLASAFLGADTVVLATTSPKVMLHELIHSVFSITIGTYFENINYVPATLRQPINDLVQLLERFKKLNGSDDLRWTQGVVTDLENKGDKAGAVDEMLTYVISDAGLIDELSPGFFTRVTTRVKQILWGLFGREVPGEFFDDVMKSFTTLVRGPLLTVSDFTLTRDSVTHDVLQSKIESAREAIKQKQRENSNFKIPKVVDSHLTKILSAFDLSYDQRKQYYQVWALLRMDNRSDLMERYASTVMDKHPQAMVFNGSTDVVATIMALAAVDPTFAAQADALWAAKNPQTISIKSMVDDALKTSALTDSKKLLNEALDAMAVSAEYNLSYLGATTQRLDRMGSEWMDKLGTKALQTAETAPTGVAELLQGIAGLTSEVGAAAFGKSLLRAVNEFTDQRWLQDLTAAFVGSQSDTNSVYRQVNTMKSNVAQTRSLFTVTLPAKLKTLFPEGFDGWNNLFTHFGRLDVGVLGDSAAQMFSDDVARAKNIEALKSKVSNHQDAANLAHYMVHGKVEAGSPHPLLRNARAIADNLNGRKRKANNDLVADVDQLVTLMAIDKLDPADRARINGYFTQHPQAMNNLIGMLNKVSEEELKQVNSDYRYTHWKGALPLSVDPRTSVVIAGPVKGASLEALGYTKGKRYSSSPNDPLKDIHYYTRKYAPPPVFTQGVLATVQETAMGVNYVTAATISPEVGTVISDRRLVSYIKRNMGTNNNLVPIFNKDGDVAGYERLLDRQYVQEQTNSDNTMLHIAIGKKLGRILEERLAKRFNKEAVNILHDQWKNRMPGDDAQYIDVAASTDKQIIRAWEVIPSDTREALEEIFGGPVMIRKDLLANTLGYHKTGVGDIFTGDASLSETTRRALYGLAQTITLGPSGVKYLYAAELAIKEGVATAKDWIIVRSISVAIANAMASMTLVMANGVPISELFNSYREGLRDIRAYNRLEKEVIGLTVQIAGASGAEVERLRTIQNGKRASIRKLAIWPLIEAGELSDLPEGLEDTPQHSYLGDMGGWLNNHLKKIHPKTPMVLANLAIAKDTAFHDVLSKSIQAGDFLGKWAVYKHMVKSGKSPDVARDEVRDEFVSYTTNPGRFRGAMEDFGLVWWSQFTIRAQKVLLRRFRKNPFSFFVSSMSGNLTGMDTPTDAAIWERGWDNSTGLDQALNSPSAHIWAKVF